MTPLTNDDLQALLARGQLTRADPQLGIGGELSCVHGFERQVVVHFGSDDSQPYMRDVADRILSLEDEWILLPRYGDAGRLGLLDDGEGAVAIQYAGQGRHALADYLCTRSVDVGAACADLYVLSGSGQTLVTWDHHTSTDGLSIQMHGTAQASRLLAALNELGAELEVFYANVERPQGDV